MPRKRMPTVSIEIKPSKIDSAGVGIFAVRGFKKGDIIGSPDYEPGVFLTWNEISKLDEKTQQIITKFCIGRIEGVWAPLNFDMIPALVCINHNCDYNVGFDKVNNFIAVRKIAAGEELYLDYGLSNSNPNWSMECECGALNCRKRITGNDWRFLTKNKINKKYSFSIIRDLNS